ncbi:MAG: indole-3-glycerol phosphate synthase TrpC [bacterium]
MGMMDQFVAAARARVETRRSETPLTEIEGKIELGGDGQRPFKEALTRPGISVIAEFKRRSPSAGDIRPEASVAEVALAYEQAGAAAMSVLTDGDFFGGSLADLREARSCSDLPILEKDFVVDPYQLYEAKANGADAVLLIVAALAEDDLASLHREARAIDLDCLVEVHDREELEAALAIEADVLGINNRNLDDLSVDIGTTLQIVTEVPAGMTVVSESGIATRETVVELDRVGVDAVLVGEALMAGGEPGSAFAALFPGEEGTSEHRLP